MPSKYQEFLGNLSRLAPADRSYQERVDEYRRNLVPEVTTDDLVRRWRSVRSRIDEQNDVLSALNLELEAVKQKMCDAFESAGVTKIELAEGGGCRVEPEVVARVLDKSVLRGWAKANGYEESLTLMPQTVTSIAKERLLEGLEPPDGVEIGFRTKTVIIR